ncbi:hypothetical protein LIT38_20285 [Bacillus sp. CMF12]|uniref:hypothetical protein n=1 Tax=Bacillus sp. CMF12 TaxID=2884834 RepID=UPI00207AD036|nr:hypothetical protein [Bacillus sp. CMF12]USK48850.1 hypothetical protein LIT38_20285 [Bacillus sp. CMF12]
MLKREVLNRILLMRLIELSNGILGKTRLQKLVFETEARTRRSGNTNTFNYKFIRWHYGPYSKELKNDMEFLINQGLVIEGPGHKFQISPKGLMYIEKTWSIVNQFFKSEDKMAQTISELNNKSLSELLAEVYENHNVMEYKMGEVIEDLKYVGASE